MANLRLRKQQGDFQDVQEGDKIEQQWWEQKEYNKMFVLRDLKLRGMDEEHNPTSRTSPLT